MQTPSADRNLLYGILALQLDFITRDALVIAMNAWVLDKGKPLGQILRNQGALEEEEDTLLEAMVRKHVEKHGGDPQQSLASLNLGLRDRETLGGIDDGELQAGLLHSSSTEEGDPYRTRMPSVATTTSTGHRFTILRPHARGGLGAVFVAHDEELRREVALKEIQERHADNPQSQARFLLEAEVTGSLEHPGIVPVYGLGHYADGRPYYAMRFIRGTTLDDEIRRYHEVDQQSSDSGKRALAFRKLLRSFVDVCNAIDYAHSRGILHRDIKPTNIMIGGYGETLVVDWGLAKILDHQDLDTSAEKPFVPSSASAGAQTVDGSTVGTPQFMSPEQAEGRLDLLGPSSDVYSLGATLYVLLTGRPPFGRIRLDELLKRTLRGEINPPRRVNRTVPRALEAVCLKAMAKKNGDRYQSPKALADDIEKWLGFETVSAYRETLLEVGVRLMRNRLARLAWFVTLFACNITALPIWIIYHALAQKYHEIFDSFGVEPKIRLTPTVRFPFEIDMAIIQDVLPAIAVFASVLIPLEVGGVIGFLAATAIQSIRKSAKKSDHFFLWLGLILGSIYGLASGFDTWNDFKSFFQLITKLSG